MNQKKNEMLEIIKRAAGIFNSLSWLVLLVIVLPLSGFCQVKITGTILNMTDTKPIAGASVFLSNTTSGGETAEDGTFTLYNIKPGKYDLIVSVVGFENSIQSIIVDQNDLHLAPISLVSSTILLNAVRIRPDKEWFRLYEEFKKQFLGTSAYAKGCKIMNPDSLDLSYDAATRQLAARSRGFLVIENKALGYRIKYLLLRFIEAPKENALSYIGYPLFEELKGSASEKQTWAKNRLDCYQGSAMHFFRSVIQDKVEAEGFELYKIVRTLNAAPPSRSFNNGLIKIDSVTKYHLRFVDTLLKRVDYFDETQKKGIYVLDFPYDLYIAYKNKLDYEQDRAGIYKQFDMPNYETTIATFAQEPDSAGIPKDTIWVAYPKLWSSKRVLKKPYAFFDENGVLTNPLSLRYDGFWAFMRVAELLPVDYEPPSPARKTKKESK